MTTKDIEQTAEEHICKVVDIAGHPGWDWTTQDIADAFIAGAEWMKKQIMEEAVEVMVTSNLANNPIIYFDDAKKLGLKYGDKVRVIIVKED